MSIFQHSNFVIGKSGELMSLSLVWAIEVYDCDLSHSCLPHIPLWPTWEKGSVVQRHSEPGPTTIGKFVLCLEISSCDRKFLAVTRKFLHTISF